MRIAGTNGQDFGMTKVIRAKSCLRYTAKLFAGIVHSDPSTSTEDAKPTAANGLYQYYEARLCEDGLRILS